MYKERPHIQLYKFKAEFFVHAEVYAFKVTSL